MRFRTILKSVGRGAGWLPDRPSHKDWPLSKKLGGLPNAAQSVSLKREFYPKVRDQGELGSCVGHAVSACLAYKMRERYPDKLGGEWGQTWDLSPLAAYWLARERDNSTDVDVGAYIRDGVDAAREHGIPTEATWPYNPSRFRRRPSAKAFEEGRWHQADTVATYRCDEDGDRAKTISRMLQALSAGLPLVLGFSCFSNLSDADQTGEIPLPGWTSALEGGHAVPVFAADVASRRFIGPNSWGADWGFNGFYSLPFDYILNGWADDVWACDLEQAPA